MQDNFTSNLIEKLRTRSVYEVLSREKDGRYFAALSPDRVNVIEWYPFRREQTLLQYGAENGAFLSLADRVKIWDVYDADASALDVVKARIAGEGRSLAVHSGNDPVNRSLMVSETTSLPGEGTSLTHQTPSLTHQTPFPTHQATALPDENLRLLTVLPEDARYDVLFLAAWPGKQKAEELIEKYTPETVLILAENRNALRFIAGAERDPEKQYAAAEELKGLASVSVSVKLYFPLPSLQFAKDIRSEDALPGPGDFRGISVNYTEDQAVTCDEEALYDSLAAFDSAAVQRFAPAFLCVLRMEKEQNFAGEGRSLALHSGNDPVNRSPMMNEAVSLPGEGASLTHKTSFLTHHALSLSGENAPLPDYIRYNRSRKAEYRIRTELYKNEKAVKTALTGEADGHIAGFKERCALLSKYVPEEIKVLEPRFPADASPRASVTFPFLKGESLGQQLAAKIKDGRAPEEDMETALTKMLGDESRPQFNPDILFGNILVDETGTWNLIDYEWVSEEPLPYRFVRYRVLRYFYEDNAQTLTAYRSLADYLTVFGFAKEEQAEWEQKEDAFQLSVHGVDKGSFEERYKKDPASVSKIREQARALYADEIDELKTTLRKEREVERLSQQHIRNIESINRDRDAEIEALKAETAWLQGHISLTAKIKRKLIRKLDAWAPADSGKRLVIKYIKGTLRHPGAYLKRYLTKEGHNYIRGNFAIRGEFSEGGILEIPRIAEGQTPAVSIVIPAYNQVGYTYACIRSIIAHTDFEETSYEIILADDASTDATAEITNWIRGLKVARTGGNLGFLKNCNNAAKEARGEFIFFLNNDTKVRPGWLSSLAELMRRDESIGMCGSRLVYPDGRLQEAGGIIWSDASGWNYGRMDDPAKYCYSYVKDVDYISGAAILIRSGLWREIGGFDERYAPAYCEDSDLAFEVRRHGKRVVYQPASEVIHFEGVSNGTDVNGTGLKRYQLVNMEKFREKWAEELKNQSENTGDPNPFAARERSQKKKTILVIDHYVPRHDRDAGSRTTFQYLQMFLARGYNVKFLGDDFTRTDPYTAELEQMGIEVLYGEEIRDSVFDWLEKNKEYIDIAYLNRPHIAVKYIDWLKENTKIRCIFYGHDLHYLRIRREYELTGDIRRRRESDYWKGMEYQVMEKADMVYYPSQDEINEIHARRPEIPAKAITAYIYDRETPRLPAETSDGTSVGTHPIPAVTGGDSSLPAADSGKGRDCATGNAVSPHPIYLFVGGFKHPPNADGVLWFAKDIWPRIHGKLPEAQFLIAGSHPTEEVEALNGRDGIRVLGFVSDEELARLYADATLVLVPLRYGAGVKGKVVEALNLGRAIVTTSVGAEGIPEAETAMAIDDAPDAFADTVLRLTAAPAEAARLAAAAAPLIAKYYSTEAAWSIIAPDFA